MISWNFYQTYANLLNIIQNLPKSFKWVANMEQVSLYGLKETLFDYVAVN